MHAETLLCVSSRQSVVRGGWAEDGEDAVDLAGDVALEAASDALGAESFAGTSLDVGLGVGVAFRDVDARDSPQGEDEEKDEDPASEDDDEDSDDRLDEQLRNAHEARGWAVE